MNAEVRAPFSASCKQHIFSFTRWSRPALLALLLAVVLALAACSSDDDGGSTADNISVTIFDGTTTMTEAAASNNADYDPIVFVSSNTADQTIEVIGGLGITDGSGEDFVIDSFVILFLPEDATTGTYSTSDGAQVLYAEDFDTSDFSATLAYFSISATITVTSDGAVGSTWAGTYEADMVDILADAAETTATGSFSAVREEADF